MAEPDAGQSQLSSLRHYDAVRLASIGQIDRLEESNVDTISTPGGKAGERTALCHLSTLFPFTFGDFIPWVIAFEDAAAVALAAHQLNTGDGSIVPEISGLNDRCNVRFTIEYTDTQFDAGNTISQVVKQVDRKPGFPERRPCAFLGAYGSAISIPTSIVTGLFGYPQISGGSTSRNLDDKSQYPLFGRTIPSDTDNSIPIIIYLREVLQLTRLAIIHVNDPYGNAFVIGLKQAALKYAPDMDLVTIPLYDGEGAEKVTIENFKKTEFRFVFCLVFTIEVHDTLLTEAYNQGVAGNGKHTWFFGDSFLGTLDNRVFEKGSPLQLAYQGVGLLEVTSGWQGLPSYDKFVTAMESLRNQEDLEYLGSLFPTYDHPNYGSDPPFINDTDYLSAPLKSNFGPFFYEATIALGLAACEAIDSNYMLEGQAHFNNLVETSFSGVSGDVRFIETTGTRDVTSAAYRVVNWLPEDAQEGENTVEFKPFITDLYRQGSWNQLRDFVFNDGTSNLPLEFPPVLVPTSQPTIEEIPQTTLINTLVAPIVVALFCCAGIYFYFARKAKKADALGYIKRSELTFADPPEIIGRGEHGLILLAEYRGTQVAIKLVIPERQRVEELKKRKKQYKASNFVRMASKKSLSVSSLDCSLDSSKEDENNENIGLKSIVDNGAFMRRLSMTGSVSEQSGSEKFLKKRGSMASASDTVAGLRQGRPGLSRNEMTRNFIREMKTLSKLRHACITLVFGAVVEPGVEPMIVMEYMDHGSLHDVIHNDTLYLEPKQLLDILQDIVQGIRYLHLSVPQVIHGDLRSHNVLVDGRLRAKVSDFCNSLRTSREMGDGGFTGTPFWMAPELLRGESNNNTTTDVYSFGILLYEVFARQDPYEDEEPAQVLHRIADATVQKRPLTKKMPPQIQSIYQDAVQEDFHQRPSFEEIHNRLTRLKEEDVRRPSIDPGFDGKQANTMSLYDIFPHHVAQALQEGRKVEPEHKDCVTIFFSDIVGYTRISETMPARKVASLLDRLYTKFDALSGKHDIFKVETIGDAYMAVTNLVKDQPDHTKRMANFAIDTILAANQTYVDEDDHDKGCVNIRIGFHSGSVVADVVGTRNLRYCLFGDSVNTASRMESNSKPNRIHCSSASAKLLHEQNPDLPLRARGLIPIKGKGEMHTYWVNEKSNSKVDDEALAKAQLLDWESDPLSTSLNDSTNSGPAKTRRSKRRSSIATSGIFNWRPTLATPSRNSSSKELSKSIRSNEHKTKDTHDVSKDTHDISNSIRAGDSDLESDLESGTFEIKSEQEVSPGRF